MKTLKLDQFEKFECNVSQMEKVRGGEKLFSGNGLDGVNGGCVDEFIDTETGERSFEKAPCQ